MYNSDSVKTSLSFSNYSWNCIIIASTDTAACIIFIGSAFKLLNHRTLQEERDAVKS